MDGKISIDMQYIFLIFFSVCCWREDQKVNEFTITSRVKKKKKKIKLYFYVLPHE